jgi:transcriptional regulator NrdR family protein
MLCPECIGKTRVIGTQSSFETERFRKCPDCGYSFSTIEKIKAIVGDKNRFFLPKNQDTLNRVSNK